mmetsp:Transcript_10007/g.11801  ORF Transcript_10007/g.11801 Transcript_10007/m.11801 type:complete len:156 (-) Transcript_10007:88-555(-)
MSLLKATCLATAAFALDLEHHHKHHHHPKGGDHVAADQDPAVRRALEGTFRMMDLNKDGEVTRGEFATAYKGDQLDFYKVAGVPTICTCDWCEKVGNAGFDKYKRVDTDGDRELSPEEWVADGNDLKTFYSVAGCQKISKDEWLDRYSGQDISKD